MRRSKVFAGSSHPELAELICEHLGISLASSTLKKFSNKETSVEIGCSVRNEDVFIIQSGSSHVNDHLMELLIMISACKGASASRITAVMPYFPYSKQSKKKRCRSAITAKMVANLLSVAGVDHIITLDLHASQMQGFFNKPVDNLYAEPCIVKWIKKWVPEYADNGVIVSKNVGGTKRVTSLADRLKIDFALIHTDRARGRSWSMSDVDDEEPQLNGNDSRVRSFSMTHNGNVSTSIINCRPAEDEEDDESYSSATSATGELLSVEDLENPPNSTITLVGNVSGKVAFIVDDIIDNAATFVAAAEHLKKCNAKCVYVIATHGILSGSCLKEIENCSAIYKLVVTNSFPIPIEKKCQSPKLTIMNVSETLAEAIRRTHNGESISALF